MLRHTYLKWYANTHTHTHTNTHTHTQTRVCTHTQINSSTHCGDINNSYFSTLSTPMVVTTKVALKKHLYKTAHIVQFGLETVFLYNFSLAPRLLAHQKKFQPSKFSQLSLFFLENTYFCKF